MPHPKLNWALARYALQLATSEELIEAAHAALDDGYYSHSLGELASQYDPTNENSQRLFGSAVRELGLKLPGQAACVELMLEAEAIEVVECRIEPYQILERLYRECEGYEFSGHPILGEWISHFYQLEESRNYDFPYISRVESSEDHLEFIERLQQFLLFARNWILDRNRPFLQAQWLTSTVVGLAGSIAEDRAFDRLPILADALQDAGCDLDDWLDHLRLVRNHPQSCWVVELLRSERPTP